MADHEEYSLIPLPDVSLANTTVSAQRIMSAMVEETLALTRREQASIQAAKWKIGDYEFCEPDYRQILHWAAALALAPEIFIERLLNDQSLNVMTTQDVDTPDWAGTRFENGQIVAIHWDLALLPVSHIELVTTLNTRFFSLGNRRTPASFSMNLSGLPYLLKLD